MGFLSGFFGGIGKVIKGALTVGAGLLGVGGGGRAAAAAAVPVAVRAVAPTVATRALRAAGRVATSLPGTLALTAGAAALGSGLAGTRVEGPGGTTIFGTEFGQGGRGNGQFVRQTTVQTFDLSTGAVVRQQVFDGAPFLMNNEVRRLRTVARKLGRANAKLPRRTVKQSPLSELKDAAVSAALTNVRKGCPPA